MLDLWSIDAKSDTYFARVFRDTPSKFEYSADLMINLSTIFLFSSRKISSVFCLTEPSFDA